MFNGYKFTVADRFMKYAQVDTQSDPHATEFPSTKKQLDLSRMLVTELKALGVDDAELDAFGYVMATITANSDKVIPVICLCSHVDTAPDVSGKDVKPLLHMHYDG